MLKTRVIPLLLLMDGLLKKPLRFTERPRTVANALSIARVFEARQVDELILLDIGSGRHGRNINPTIVQQIADNLTIPFTVGGGVRSVATMISLVAAGAEKITINTGALQDATLISNATRELGSQCVVVSIDAHRCQDGSYRVMAENGRTESKWDVVDWALRVQEWGAGEVLLNAIHRDGTMEGYDLELVRIVTDALDIPVVAAGGAGNLEHFVDAVLEGRAHAVAAGSIFFFRRTTPLMVKQAMNAAGIPVRLSAAPDGESVRV